jgi:hypothetical protein
LLKHVSVQGARDAKLGHGFKAVYARLRVTL